MKTFYIISCHKSALYMMRSFKTKYFDKYDQENERRHEEREKIFSNYFYQLQSGAINLFYTVSTQKRSNGETVRTFTAYHRSPKQPGKIQESFYYTVGNNPEIIALSDQQYTSAAEAIKDGIKAGAYIVI